MLIPKKNRIAVYAYLFKEGVLVAKKDFALPKHPDIDVPNLQVIKLMQSMKSRNYVKENFNWQYYYYYLTNEGIEYLREYLHLPPEIVPVTLKKTARTAATGGRPSQRYGDRDGGRPRGPPSDKKVGPGSDFKPEFRGYGRSRGGFRGGEGGFGAPRGDREGGFEGEHSSRGGFEGERSSRGGGFRGGEGGWGASRGGREGGFEGERRGGFGGDRGSRGAGSFGRGRSGGSFGRGAARGDS